jgi:hypothetical protein
MCHWATSFEIQGAQDTLVQLGQRLLNSLSDSWVDTSYEGYPHQHQSLASLLVHRCRFQLTMFECHRHHSQPCPGCGLCPEARTHHPC